MQELLAWATSQGILLTSATVGTVHVEIAHMVRSASNQTQSDAAATRDIYEQFGGGMFKDLEPALGAKS